MRRCAADLQLSEPKLYLHRTVWSGIRCRPDFVGSSQQPTDEVDLMGQHVIQHSTPQPRVAQEIGLRLPARAGNCELEANLAHLATFELAQALAQPLIGYAEPAGKPNLKPAPGLLGGPDHPHCFVGIESHRLFHQHV
jgi:hypothetical protein